VTEADGRVLVVDDEESVRALCRRTLAGPDRRVRTAPDAASALERLREERADVVLTDLSMPGAMDGAALTEEIRRLYPETDVIVMTGYPALETAVPTLKSGAYDYLVKPFSPEFLRSTVSRCFGKRQLKAELGRERRLREELQAAYQELQKVEGMKDGFLARVNHELRTPLAPIVLALRMLEAEALGGRAKRFVGIVRESVDRLRETIEALLLFAEIRQPDPGFYRTELELGAVMRRLVETYRPIWEERGVAVEVVWPAGGDRAWACPKLVEAAFSHLLLNAVQFNRRGGRVSIEGRSSGDGWLVSVADTGAGIPADKIGRVFDTFYQTAEYLTREVGGLGLGLSIVRRVAELHGGTVTVRSREGEGSRFELWLPVREPAFRRILRAVGLGADA
jgi:signal transduction histidine kinase